MNLVKTILDLLLSGDILGKLSAFLGADKETTQKAATAAVPTILSSLAGLAATDDGARKLSSTLGNLEPSMLGNLTNMLTGETSSVAQKGSSLLSSLFGDSLVSNIASSVGRYAGLDTGASKKLMSLIGPVVLGTVANQWKNQGGGLGALTNLLVGQQKNIAAALPSGFSLASIPGLPSAEAKLRAVGNEARAASTAAVGAARRSADAAQDATTSILKWAGPLACLLLAALALWYFFGRERAPRDVAQNRPPQGPLAPAEGTAVKTLKPTLPDLPSVPDVTTVTKDLSGIFSTATQTLGNIRDAASAQAALPRLRELNTKIDGIRDSLDKLPAAGQAALGQLIDQQYAPFHEQASRIMAAPDVSDQIKDALESITSKLAGLNLAQVSKEATGIFTTLTKTLSDITDRASVEDALPQLREVSAKVDDLKRVQANMSPGGQTMLGKLVSSALGSLNQTIAKVLVALGADAAVIKPVLDEIVFKLTRLAPEPRQT